MKAEEHREINGTLINSEGDWVCVPKAASLNRSLRSTGAIIPVILAPEWMRSVFTRPVRAIRGKLKPGLGGLNPMQNFWGNVGIEMGDMAVIIGVEYSLK